MNKKITIYDSLSEYNSMAKHQQDLIQYEGGFCRCIACGCHGSTPHLLKTLIIRKENNEKH